MSRQTLDLSLETVADVVWRSAVHGSWGVLALCRKLAVFDTWSSLAVHIAMDNTVVMEEISKWLRALVVGDSPRGPSAGELGSQSSPSTSGRGA